MMRLMATRMQEMRIWTSLRLFLYRGVSFISSVSYFLVIYHCLVLLYNHQMFLILQKNVSECPLKWLLGAEIAVLTNIRPWSYIKVDHRRIRNNLVLLVSMVLSQGVV
jgi:hypothetical protein